VVLRTKKRSSFLDSWMIYFCGACAPMCVLQVLFIDSGYYHCAAISDLNTLYMWGHAGMFAGNFIRREKPSAVMEKLSSCQPHLVFELTTHTVGYILRDKRWK
jgi:hypothetical protein